MRTIIGTALLMISMALHCHAQSSFEPPLELSIEGKSPELTRSKDIFSFHYFANDNKGNTWFVTPFEVWSFSPDSLKWTQWPSIQFEDMEVRNGYDKAADRFLFWNNGVGKVFTWKPGDTVMQRIDQSFHHRTQFGHAWFIHPKTSDIYAFGGFGFWESRGYTSRFDQKTKEWQVLTLDATKPYPSPRSTSRHAYDEKRNQLHIFGGSDYRNNGREDLSIDFVDYNDYWVLDVDRREWSQQPIFGSGDMFDFNKELRRNIENLYYGMTDYENDLAWYTERSSLGANDIRLMVFDLERGFGAYTPLSLGDLGFRSSVLWYNIDKEKNQLLLFWIEAISNRTSDRPLRVSVLQLPHPDSTRAMMDVIRKYGSIDPPSEASNLWEWLWVLVPLGLGVALAWRFVLGRSSTDVSADEVPPAAPPEIIICFLGEPKILVDGVVARNKFNSPEFEIFLWLYWKHRRGEPYQITDTIESVFWHDSPNMDYIRKQRNTTLRRLNDQIAELFKRNASGHDWIVDRTSISDKRKREYALDLGGLIVRCDLDDIEPGAVDPSRLLESQTGIWVTQIRSEYALLSAAS